MPLTLVPVELPMSCNNHTPLVHRISACIAHTDGSLILILLVCLFPTVQTVVALLKLVLLLKLVPLQGPAQHSNVKACGT